MHVLWYRFRTHLAWASAILWTVSAGPAAQTAFDVILDVPANQTVSTPTFSVTGIHEIQITLQGASASRDPILSVFVYDEHGILCGRDDQDVPTDVFRWSTAVPGNYYIRVQNTGGSSVQIRVRRVEAPAVARGLRADRAVVRVFFATDRVRAGNTPATFFGSEPGSQLQYGYADVSIPRDHQIGELEGPSVWRLEFRQDDDRHVVLQLPHQEPSSSFFRRVSNRIATSAKKEALVFIHGFNVPFEDAARRTAQISYDLAFDGAPILYSWPSQGALLPWDYRKDQRNADLSIDSLSAFLRDLARCCPEITIHVIAHSMGNRVLFGALQQLSLSIPSARTPVLSEVAMLAPDIDAELFRRAIGKVKGTAHRVTLYASSMDAALRLSQRYGGYKRAGQAGRDIVIVDGVDTIDVSSVETSRIGLFHAYYADNSTILSDLFSLLRGRPIRERFGLNLARAGRYWEFRPAAR